MKARNATQIRFFFFRWGGGGGGGGGRWGGGGGGGGGGRRRIHIFGAFVSVLETAPLFLEIKKVGKMTTLSSPPFESFIRSNIH